MNPRKFTIVIMVAGLHLVTLAQEAGKAIYSSSAYSIYNDRVEQGNFKAVALSAVEMQSDYRSPDADRYSPLVSFKFSINERDNEMPQGKYHMVTLQPVDGRVETTVTFGEQLTRVTPVAEGVNLSPNTKWKVRLDMREVFKSFEQKGYHELFNGERLERADFKGVYIAGSAAPLSWDFVNLHNRPELQLVDPDGDHIFETTLVMNSKENEEVTDTHWKKSLNTSGYPQYKSDYLISDAIYNLSLEEMLKAIEPDSTFRTGKEWSGVWTRDISYSIILSMAHLQPAVAVNSLMRKVSKDKRIIQDTGTGGAWPNSTDRMIWANAAWEIYKATGDRTWLEQAYVIIKNSIEDDLQNVYDSETGMVKGESSFLDWREQTYPLWMQPVDIFESECLGTNAVHYKANLVLSEMAKALDQKEVAEKHERIAVNIKEGINKYLWLPEHGYYAQFLYGRHHKIASPRAEALGEALCVIFGIADEGRAKQLVHSTPVTPYGIPCINPQIPGIPPYHNNGIWPFVQSYWLWAGAMVNNERSVVESISAIYRPAALFLTNKENFVAETGDFSGTQINSSVMLWSLSGNISIVHKVLFGIRFEPDSMEFSPYVPEVLKGTRTLKDFKYRSAVLDIELSGFGSRISSFEVDGKKLSRHVIPGDLQGKHSINIHLDNVMPQGATTNMKPVKFTVQTPVLKLDGGAVSSVPVENGTLSWLPVENATAYIIIVNGARVGKITGDSFSIKDYRVADYTEFQVIAVDGDGLESFASEPLGVSSGKESVVVIEAEDFALKAVYPYKGWTGEGFIEVSKTVNRKVTFEAQVGVDGVYAINFRYSNGNGPTNTENKCGIRTLTVDGKAVNAVIFPQRGKEEWSNWGFSNALKVQLDKGKHTIVLSLEDSNQNMNGQINQAMIDNMRVVLLRVL